MVKMVKKVSLGSTKRFGVRYGRRNRDKVAIIEQGHRGRHKCPFCNYEQLVRLSKGIWQCKKCNVKFAGKAYTYETPKKGTALIEEVTEEIEETEEEDYTEQNDAPAKEVA